MRRWIHVPTGVIKTSAELIVWLKKMHELHVMGDPDATTIAREMLQQFYPLED